MVGSLVEFEGASKEGFFRRFVNRPFMFLECDVDSTILSQVRHVNNILKADHGVIPLSVTHFWQVTTDGNVLSLFNCSSSLMRKDSSRYGQWLINDFYI